MSTCLRVVTSVCECVRVSVRAGLLTWRSGAQDWTAEGTRAMRPLRSRLSSLVASELHAIGGEGRVLVPGCGQARRLAGTRPTWQPVA